jgi:hypothetical protein
MKLRGIAGCFAVAALSMLLTSCGSSSCANVVIGDSIALDEEHRAVVFVRTCGADAPSTNVSITPGTGRMPSDTGNVFSADGDRGMVKAGAKGELAVKAVWLDSKLLRVEYPRDARMLLASPKLEDIEVRYVPLMAPGGR